MILNGKVLESIRKILEEHTVLLRLLTVRLGSEELTETFNAERAALRRIIDRQRKALEKDVEDEPPGLPERSSAWHRRSS